MVLNILFLIILKEIQGFDDSDAPAKKLIFSQNIPCSRNSLEV